jgi:hypothetical protein
MEKLTQEKINQEAQDGLNNLLSLEEIENLLKSIRLTNSRNVIGKTFEYGDKEYAIYGKGDYKGATIRVCCSDGRALDLNVECYYIKHSTIDDDMSGELGIDYEYCYNLPDQSKLIHVAYDGTEINTPNGYVFKLVGPKGEEKILNGFLLPRGTTVTPSGILSGDSLVSKEADRIIDEPMPTSNGYKKKEPLVCISMIDLSRIKTANQDDATKTQNEILTRLTRLLNEEVKKRIEDRRETVEDKLETIQQMLKDKEALISKINVSTFTSEELRMFANCLDGKDIRDGIETR